MEVLVTALSSITLSAIFTHAVPLDACFATFRWDDCGQPPQPVMYYWKPGSRCEVGIWKGCLPNLNMFKDEYECVSTCIFAVRARAPDFHSFNVDYDTTPADYTDLTTDETGSTGGTGDGTDETGGSTDGTAETDETGGDTDETTAGGDASDAGAEDNTADAGDNTDSDTTPTTEAA